MDAGYGPAGDADGAADLSSSTLSHRGGHHASDAGTPFEPFLPDDGLLGSLDDERSSEAKALTTRHLIYIAIAGSLGTGLFVGSGATIAIAGPGGALLAFLLAAILVGAIVTTLGEIATQLPLPGGITTMAHIFVNPACGLTLGWNYWFQWAISLPSELSALGIIMSFWWPTVPAWIWSGSALIVLMLIHFAGARSFGETEAVLSIIKIAACFAFIAIGLLLDVGWMPGASIEAPKLKYWSHYDGAPFKNGVSGLLAIFLMAFFAFGGSELVGITASQAKEPRRSVPKAIRGTMVRLVGFYFLSIAVLGLTVANDDPALLGSGDASDITTAAFTLVFHRAGLSWAAHLMNFVVLCAVLSAGNSALYAASQTIQTMACRGQAPAALAKNTPSLSALWQQRQHPNRPVEQTVPARALLLTAAFGTVTFLGIFWDQGRIFEILVGLAGISAILTYGAILYVHYRFRQAIRLRATQPAREQPELVYRSPLYPVWSITSAALIVVIILSIFIDAFGGFAAINGSNNGAEGNWLLRISLFGIPIFFGIYVEAVRFVTRRANRQAPIHAKTTWMRQLLVLSDLNTVPLTPTEMKQFLRAERAAQSGSR